MKEIVKLLLFIVALVILWKIGFIKLISFFAGIVGGFLALPFAVGVAIIIIALLFRLIFKIWN